MDIFTRKRAHELFEKGLQAVAQGNVRLARENFKASAEKMATADSLTYWGWMEHQLGNTESAINLCHKAISLDPDFGNPYNDIGSYLMTQGRGDEAIAWLEKAVRAKRYAARHFPHINLSRIYVQKNMPMRALRELYRARKIAPQDSEVQRMIESVRQILN